MLGLARSVGGLGAITSCQPNFCPSITQALHFLAGYPVEDIKPDVIHRNQALAQKSDRRSAHFIFSFGLASK
jgi:hypothetical protein